METSEISLMIMYEDESVDVRYRNGAQLQLSPCGCEFLLVKATDPHRHPLQPTERVRQRTRFTISTYRELLVAALAFRNKYADRPYLPEELISADHKKCVFSIEPCVQWPEWSSCEAELGPGGEIITRSEEGQAMLTLSPSGEEFSVEFTCSLSRPQKQHHSIQCFSRDPDGSSGSHPQTSDLISEDNETKVVHQGRGPTRSQSCSRMINAAQHKPEQMYQSTTVVQHQSCCSVAPTWAYPLSLARHHWKSRLSKHEDIPSEETSSSCQANRRMNMPDVSYGERRSQLPQALPPTCPSPHRHRWKYKEPLATEEESDLPRDLVKIIWCQGVTYRILSEIIPVIEISPGDGSVIRSNGVLNSYFTHHKPPLQSEQTKELTYHLNSLPPDVFGQMYSVCSIVSRASRILACYSQAKQLLKLPVEPSCLQEDKHFSKTKMFEQRSSSVLVEHHLNVTQTVDNRSNLVATELEKIKRFNFLLENTPLLRGESEDVNLDKSPAEDIQEPLNEDYIAKALQRTSKAIQDIDALTSGATLT
ncbi:uncharacterized protein C5orf34 homolog [Melanotaenia boesemani]|uniref:uncharacterized protein C5orf34 homolog n=1 Tax=Melanotaenia boesemani TaxID=1250792 RepID=UPI001C046210|nr:uncharacterized protein C5orf34 homolog [Melanotaenia boesemani]